MSVNRMMVRPIIPVLFTLNWSSFGAADSLHHNSDIASLYNVVFMTCSQIYFSFTRNDFKRQGQTFSS